MSHKIFTNQGFLKYFENTSFLLVEKFLRMSIGLVVGIWLAKYLGPAQFGTLNYCISFVGLFMPIAMLGLDAVVVKKIVNEKDNINKILGTSFIMKLFGAFLAFVLITLSATLFTSNTEKESLIILIITLSLFFQSFNVIDFFYQSEVKSKYTVYSSLFSLIISSALKIIFIYKELDLIYFVFIILLDSILLTAGLLIYYRKRNFTIFSWRWNVKISKDLLSESWPLILSGISFVIYNSVDKIMLRNILSDQAVGIYSAASRLVVVWQFLPGLIVTSFLPSLITAYNTNSKTFMKRLKYLSSFLLWFSIVLALIYSLFSEFIMDITFGEKYIKASQLIVYLIWSNVLIFFNSVWNRWMLIKNNTRITLSFALTTSILNIILNYFLINMYGVIGASIALISSLLLSYFIFYIVMDFKVIRLFFSSLFLTYLKD